MNEKVLLILVDGMRPDSLEKCRHPFIKEMISKSSYTLNAKTVMPSITLPCHMSLFHSVTPDRHGILTNTYTPQVRPVTGLCEQLRANNKACGFFYNWGELRDLTYPDSLAYSCYLSGHIYTYSETNKNLTDRAIEYINSQSPDFTFLYLGETDEVGHKHGWMTDEYIKSVYSSWECIQRIVTAIPRDYTVIITADHGGHDRNHGTDMPEDMTIPMILKGKAFAPSKKIENVNILDIAPTIVKLLDTLSDEDWEGKSLI